MHLHFTNYRREDFAFLAQNLNKCFIIQKHIIVQPSDPGEKKNLHTLNCGFINISPTMNIAMWTNNDSRFDKGKVRPLWCSLNFNVLRPKDMHIAVYRKNTDLLHVKACFLKTWFRITQSSGRCRLPSSRKMFLKGCTSYDYRLHW